MNKRQIEAIAEDIYHLVFNRLDGEIDIDGDDAGNLATRCQEIIRDNLSIDEEEKDSALTAHKLMGMGLWDQFCGLKGYSVWCVNEGQLDGDEELTLSVSEMIDLGLVEKKGQW